MKFQSTDLMRQTELTYKQIILQHIDRISQIGTSDFELKAAGLSKAIDSDKTFIQQVRLLHYMLQPYRDEKYVTQFKLNLPKDGDRMGHERWFGILMELLARLNMLIEPEIIEEDTEEYQSYEPTTTPTPDTEAADSATDSGQALA